jgi:hypothetical protein
MYTEWHVNTEINEKNFYNYESDVTQNGNIVVSLNLLCGAINRNTNFKHYGGNISLFENSPKRICIVRSFVIECYKCDHLQTKWLEVFPAAGCMITCVSVWPKIKLQRWRGRQKCYVQCWIFPSLQQVLIFIIRLLVLLWLMCVNLPWRKQPV